MLKLIAVNHTVMLNGYSQWLNINGKKQFYRDISSIDIRDAVQLMSDQYVAASERSQAYLAHIMCVRLVLSKV